MSGGQKSLSTLRTERALCCAGGVAASQRRVARAAAFPILVPFYSSSLSPACASLLLREKAFLLLVSL
eukprot:214662-Chlamydomonas_euryale.AAC.1